MKDVRQLRVEFPLPDMTQYYDCDVRELLGGRMHGWREGERTDSTGKDLCSNIEGGREGGEGEGGREITCFMYERQLIGGGYRSWECVDFFFYIRIICSIFLSHIALVICGPLDWTRGARQSALVPPDCRVVQLPWSRGSQWSQRVHVFLRQCRPDRGWGG